MIGLGSDKKAGLEKIICPGDCGAKLRKKCAMLRQPPSTRRKLRLVLLWWLLLTTAPHWFRLAYVFAMVGRLEEKFDNFRSVLI